MTHKSTNHIISQHIYLSTHLYIYILIIYILNYMRSILIINLLTIIGRRVLGEVWDGDRS